MVYYKVIRITIDILELAKVIIDVIVRYYGILESIISDQGSVFNLKFWSLLCYFFGIKYRLSTTFHPQTDGQMEK